jgi:hypothetical protein
MEKHKTAEDCWMAIHGKVYDVTKFLAEHPGGEEVMVEVAGKLDTTKYLLFVWASLWREQCGVLKNIFTCSCTAPSSINHAMVLRRATSRARRNGRI